MTDQAKNEVSELAPRPDPNRPERLNPHSVPMEENTLGSVLYNDHIFDIVAEIVKPDDFFLLRHALIFQAMLTLKKRGDEIEPETVEHELKASGQLDAIGGFTYLIGLVNKTPSWIHCRTYAMIVARAAQRRKLITVGAEIANLAVSEELALPEIVDRVERLVSGAIKMPVASTSLPLAKAVGLVYSEAEDAASGIQSKAIPSGYKSLDAILSGNGFEPGRLYLVAGRPGHGKTALLTDICRTKARAGFKVFDESLEMPKVEIARRMAAQELKIPSEKIKRGDLTSDQWKAFATFMRLSDQYPLTLDSAPGIEIEALCAKIRQEHAEHGIQIAAIDYLQLIETPDFNDEQRVLAVGDISRKLKLLAMELSIPVLCAAQLSRKCEDRADKRPQLSDLRESGSLEQDADVVIFVYRDVEYHPETAAPNTTELIVGKNRDGAKGRAFLYYNAPCSYFGELSHESVI